MQVFAEVAPKAREWQRTLLAFAADPSMDAALCCAGMTSKPAITHSSLRATWEAFLSVANS